jgi:hypothetical protein
MEEYCESNATLERGLSVHEYEDDPKYWKKL